MKQYTEKQGKVGQKRQCVPTHNLSKRSFFRPFNQMIHPNYLFIF